jgi:CheY-like chemotaxis protein
MPAATLDGTRDDKLARRIDSGPMRMGPCREKGANVEADGKCVLVIDDDADLRESLGAVLSAAGHSYETAVDGVEGLNRLRGPGRRPCVVLLDLMMPRMSGFELRAVMKSDPALSDIPVVVLTGAGALASRRAGELDAEILMKPIELGDLLEVVEKHCPRATVQPS